MDFAETLFARRFDLILAKDTAHHFAPSAIDEIHRGFCRSLVDGGRYVMVVRRPPSGEVPVGAAVMRRWSAAYTPFVELLASMRRCREWTPGRGHEVAEGRGDECRRVDRRGP